MNPKNQGRAGGREAAASPVLRVLSPAWRFDVPIPEGANLISLVVMEAGDGSREDFANWALRLTPAAASVTVPT